MCAFVRVCVYMHQNRLTCKSNVILLYVIFVAVSEAIASNASDWFTLVPHLCRAGVRDIDLV